MSSPHTWCCCVSVCPEVTIRSSVVKGEKVCPRRSCPQPQIYSPCFTFACLPFQDLTWWKRSVWPRELTRLWRALQPSLLCSTLSRPTPCTETSNSRRAPSMIISSAVHSSPLCCSSYMCSYVSSFNSNRVALREVVTPPTPLSLTPGCVRVKSGISWHHFTQICIIPSQLILPYSLKSFIFAF